MTNIKTAQELYEISKNKAPEIVAGILDGVREHIIQRCEEEANEGATYYSIYLKKGLSYTKDLLLEECIKLVKEFENNGYKVEVKEVKNFIKWIEKLLRIYEPEYLMVISWKDIN